MDLQEFMALARTRYSVRAFDSRPVEETVLTAVLEAGRVAPTAKNLQPQRIYVARGDSLEALRRATPCHFNAPVLLAFCSDTAVSAVTPAGYNTAAMDASIVATHVMLAAAAQGLGTTWVCRFDPVLVREALQLPERVVPYCLMPLGYPAADAAPSERHALRQALETMVTYRV